MEDILDKFKKADTSNFPDFHSFNKPLEQGLWVLCVAKDELDIKKLTAEEIASILVEVCETSVKPRVITNSFNKSKGKKVHVEREDGVTKYKIMKAGKDHLKPEERVMVHYFEPNQRFGSKRILSTGILSNLKGELKIIDPYCDKKTLDILENAGKTKLNFLTRISNIHTPRKQRSFLRDLQDFKSDYPDVEFRDYPQNDIHDRYLISDDAFVIIGYSLKDFGKKETFITVFKNNNDIREQLLNNFNSKWNISASI